MSVNAFLAVVLCVALVVLVGGLWAWSRARQNAPAATLSLPPAAGTEHARRQVLDFARREQGALERGVLESEDPVEGLLEERGARRRREP